jgi:putative hydrolase of the HAD superfamily
VTQDEQQFGKEACPAPLAAADRDLPNGLILDWGGVLFRLDWTTVAERWDERLSLPKGTTLEALFGGTDGTVLVGKIAAEEHWGAVRRRLAISAEGCEALRADIDRAGHLETELVTFVRALRPRTRTAALTNGWSDTRAMIERHTGDDFVDEIVVSAEVGVAKPDSQIFALALERLSLPAADVVLVDDQPENIEAARSLGITAILHRTEAATIQAITNMLR